jgi:hypothetical protein
VAIGFRILWMLILVVSFTGCLNVGVRDLSSEAMLPLGSPSFASGSQVIPFIHDVETHTPSRFAAAGRSVGFSMFPSGKDFLPSLVRFSRNSDGSVSLHSEGRPLSLLHGLDPALVDPALLPFLFPSCDVPVQPRSR